MSGIQSEGTVTLTLCLLMSVGWAGLLLGVSSMIARIVRAARERHAIWWTALMLSILPVAATLLVLLLPLPNVLPDAREGAFTVLLDSGAAAAGVPAPKLWNWIGAASPLVAVVYGAGLVWHAGLLAYGQFRLAQLAADCRPISDPRLTRSLQRWRDRLGLARLPQLQSTSLEISPFLFGWRRPVLVLPDALLQEHERDTTGLICAHELAHLRRGDTWLVSVQRTLSVLVWFNPFARLIIRRLNASREAACDVLVLDHAAHERRAYARALLTALRLGSRRPVRFAALGVSLVRPGRKEHEMRLKAILAHRAGVSSPGRTLLCSAVLLAAFGPAAGIQVALAKETARSASIRLSSLETGSPAGERPLQRAASRSAETLEACTEDPKPVSRVPPEYPVPGAEARVVLSFTIAADGRTRDVDVVNSTDSRFDKAAADSVKQWRYAPCGDDAPEERKGVRVMIKFKQHTPGK